MKGEQFSFPADFLWGASTAAHQVEGGTHNQWSVWEKQHAQTLAETAEKRLGWLPSWSRVKPQAQDPQNYISGAGVGHYTRYKEDFRLLKSLNMNAFRFGVEWSRLQPQEGQWDEAAIAHYKEYIAELKRQNIEPILTLWHWTMPTWFTDKGGFAKRRNLRYFDAYVAKVAELYGQDVRYVLTLNEPTVYAGFSYGAGEWPPQTKNSLQMVHVMCNLARVHNRAYDILKAANPKLQVSIAAQLADVRALSSGLLNKASAAVHEYAADWWFVNRIRRHLDFLGLNYYFTEYRDALLRVKNPKVPTSDLGWYMEPSGIQRLLERTWAKYSLPIIIVENGLADAQDVQRKWWIEETITAMYNARQNGVDLRGYLHWSLLDNFEWAYGWWPQFGLIHVDRTTMHRQIRPSARWFASQIVRYSTPV